MRSFLLTSGLAAWAAAAPAPAPQDIEFDLVYALPNPTYTIAADVTAQAVTYTPEAIYTEALFLALLVKEGDRRKRLGPDQCLCLLAVSIGRFYAPHYGRARPVHLRHQRVAVGWALKPEFAPASAFPVRGMVGAHVLNGRPHSIYTRPRSE